MGSETEILRARLPLNEVSYEEAREHVFGNLPPASGESLDLLDALGRVLAADVRATRDDPPEDRALRDGLALASRATRDASPQAPVRLAVRGHLSAGDVPDAPLPERASVAIATGAPLPPGADAVIPAEDAVLDGETLVLRAPVGRGLHVRRRAEHFRRGDVLAPRGRVVRPEEVQALASSGYSRVEILGVPEVAVISTGSELVDVGEAVGAGQLSASNLYYLAAYVRLATGRSPSLRIVPDHPDAIASAVHGTSARIVVTTGGTAGGRKDFIRDALKDLGARILFDRVTMSPGKSFTFATLGRQVLFCFPGSPGASRTLAWLFLCPAIRRVAGRDPWETPELFAVLDRDLAARRGITRFHPARVTRLAEGLHVTPLTPGERELYVPSPETNALIYIPADVDFLKSGYEVRIVPVGEIGLEDAP